NNLKLERKIIMTKKISTWYVDLLFSLSISLFILMQLRLLIKYDIILVVIGVIIFKFIYGYVKNDSDI
ncbi:MAG: hypothetical protein LBT75_02620, partial [Bacilli bacterium]|nr:hypothetical protein [Bacilli bacterium]